MRYAVAAQSLGMILPSVFFASAFGTLFIKKMGGTDSQAMFLMAAFGLSRILQIPVSLLIPPIHGKKTLLTCYILFGVLMAAVLALSIWLETGEASVRILTVVICVALAIRNCGGTFWFPMLHDLVPAERRGRFFGKMRAVWRTTGFATVLLCSMLLGPEGSLGQFRIAIACMIALSLVSNLLFAKIPANRSTVIDDAAYGNWRDHIRRILRRREVLSFAGYFILLGFAMGFLAQPLVLYVESLGFSPRANLAISGCSMLGAVLALLIAGKLVDRLGTKRMFLTAHLAIFVLCIVTIVAGTLPRGAATILLPATLVVFGATGAIAGLACTAQLFHLAPDRGRAFFMSLGMIVMLVGPSMAPLTAGLVLRAVPANQVVNILGLHLNVFQVMLALASIGLLATIGLLHFVQDVRPART